MTLRKKITSRLILILLAAAIAVPVGIHIHEKRIPNRNFARLEKARPEYEANFNDSMQQELLEQLPEELDAPGFTWSADTLSVTSEFTWEKDPKNGWQDWNCTCNVEIIGPDSFQELPPQDQKALLDQLYDHCTPAVYDHYVAFKNQLDLEGEPEMLNEYPGLSILGYWLDADRTVNVQIVVGDVVYQEKTLSSGFYRNGEYVEGDEALIVRDKTPYVGMSESVIGATKLGHPDPQVRHRTVSTGNGKHAQATLYDYKENGWTIYTAQCVDGVVTKIWDYREEVDTRFPKPGSSSSGNSSPFPRKQKTYVYDDDEDDYYDDPYDVYDYYDPEDFYYDHEDDFYDYEDAEDYFYEHGD